MDQEIQKTFECVTPEDAKDVAILMKMTNRDHGVRWMQDNRITVSSRGGEIFNPCPGRAIIVEEANA